MLIFFNVFNITLYYTLILPRAKALGVLVFTTSCTHRAFPTISTSVYIRVCPALQLFYSLYEAISYLLEFVCNSIILLPSTRILLAAFSSLSWYVPQLGQVQYLTDKSFVTEFLYQQQLQV